MSKCKYCRCEFIQRHPSQKFCSRKCKDSWWNKRKPDRHKDPHYYSKYNRENGRHNPYFNPYGLEEGDCFSVLDSFDEPVY